MNGLTIGRMAKKAGVTIDTVRFYERRGLIAEPPRSASNYRLYPEEDAARLRFIRQAKDLGFSLTEIKELLGLRNDPAATKADVKHCAEAKIRDIKQKIKDLSRILAALEPLTATCNGHGPVSECPILEALETDQNHHHHGEVSPGGGNMVDKDPVGGMEVKRVDQTMNREHLGRTVHFCSERCK